MSFISLRAAFEKAQHDARGITKAQFLEQTRAHLESGRLRASAFACVTRQSFEPENYAQCRLVPRSADDVVRKVIRAVEWTDLELFFGDDDRGCAAIWGHDRSPDWTKDDGTGCEVWGDGWFEGAPVYSELLLLADSFNGLWHAPKEVWTEQELRAFVDDAVVKAGAYVDRRAQKALLQNVRRNVPSKLDKEIFAMFDRAQGRKDVGRPRKS